MDDRFGFMVAAVSMRRCAVCMNVTDILYGICSLYFGLVQNAILVFIAMRMWGLQLSTVTLR